MFGSPVEAARWPPNYRSLLAPQGAEHVVRCIEVYHLAEQPPYTTFGDMHRP
jgi:hypothetical protein